MNQKRASPNDEKKYWHNLSQKELFDIPSTSETGLSDQESYHPFFVLLSSQTCLDNFLYFTNSKRINMPTFLI